MKQMLLIFMVLLSPLLSSKTTAQSKEDCPECKTAPLCTKGNANFQFEYFGAVAQADGTLQIRFSVTNYSQYPMEFVTFELPGVNTPAAAPVASFISRYHYAVQNTFNDSLIKFTGLNTGTYRYDQTDRFRYQVSAVDFRNGNNATIRVLAKAGEKTSAFDFDLLNCSQQKITPLPVELISFKGSASEQGVNLNWSTASEKNCDYFVVQHSLDSNSFEAIGKVSGSGTVSSQKNYQFTHLKPVPGKNYYRLKQTDLDGTSEYSPIVVVQQETKTRAFSFSMFPNPVIGNRLNVTFGKALASHELLDLTISDLNGKTKLKKQVSKGQELTVDVGKDVLAPGMYLVKIKVGNEIQNLKILIQ